MWTLLLQSWKPSWASLQAERTADPHGGIFCLYGLLNPCECVDVQHLFPCPFKEHLPSARHSGNRNAAKTQDAHDLPRKPCFKTVLPELKFHLTVFGLKRKKWHMLPNWNSQY